MANWKICNGLSVHPAAMNRRQKIRPLVVTTHMRVAFLQQFSSCENSHVRAAFSRETSWQDATRTGC